jgi:hypothetical protein
MVPYTYTTMSSFNGHFFWLGCDAMVGGLFLCSVLLWLPCFVCEPVAILSEFSPMVASFCTALVQLVCAGGHTFKLYCVRLNPT